MEQSEKMSSESKLPEQRSILQWSKTALYKVWRFHHNLIIFILVLLAVLLLLVRGLALYLESNPQLIERFIEQQLEQSVSFDNVKINIDLFYPSIYLKNFIIQYKDENTSRFNFHAASISIDTIQSLLKSQAIINTLKLDGFHALIQRNKQGKFLLSGIPLYSNATDQNTAQNNQPAYLKLLNQSNFIITHSEIYFVDETEEYPNLLLNDVNIRMRNQSDRHQVSITTAMNQTGVRAELRLDFKGPVNKLKQWNGQIYSNLEGLDHPTLLHLLGEQLIQLENYELENIDMGIRSWALIKHGKLQSIQGEAYINDAQLKREDTKELVYFNRIDGNFRFKRHKKVRTDWVADFFDVNFNIDGKIISNKRIQLHFRNLNSKPSMQVYLNRLQFGEINHVINFFSPENFSKTLYQHIKPRGELKNLKADITFKNLDMPIDITDYQVSLELNDFGLNALHSIPKIRNLSARLLLNRDRGRAYVNSHGMSIYLKSLFRDPWPVDKLGAEIYWQKMEQQWLLGVKDIDFSNPHLKAQADLKLWFPENGPLLMDLSGYYQDANVKYTSFYLPAHIMNQGLVKWLDNAIVSGWGTDGGVVFRGEISQFPFEDYSGTMDIVFNTRDVELDYTPGWPKLQDIRSQIQFTEQGMWIESDYSRIFSSVSRNMHADIQAYDESILRLNGDIGSTINDGIHFLKQSQLASADITEMLDAQGKIDINLNLVIPTEEGEPETRVKIALDNIDYYPPGFDRRQGMVSELNGVVQVHNQDINAEKLTARIMGNKARVRIKSSHGRRRNSKNKNVSPDINIAIDTRVSVDQLKKYKVIPENLSNLSHYISGRSHVNIDVNLPNEHRPFALSVASGLMGIASKLPFPFSKTAGQSHSLQVSYTDSRNPNLAFSYSSILSALFTIKGKAESLQLIKGAVQFGTGQAYLPTRKVLKLSGKVPLLPYDQWQKVIGSLSEQDETKTKTKINKAITKVNWKTPVELALTELVLPKPESENNTAESSSGVKAEKSHLSPQSMPLVNGYIQSLKLADSDLGKLTIKTSRIDKSIVLDALKLKGDILSFTGKGKWHQWNNTPEMDMEGTLDISSFEDFLNMLGYDQLMRGGKARISGYLSWPGGPADYSKDVIEGKVSIKVEKGTYLEGKPGTAGRILGLLNMNALVRRISFDFTDVSDKGFEFEKIKGDFRITRGNAYTDNFMVQAPSAKILVTGRVGLAAEDYDEKVLVVPEISATLPIAGAAVAGPAGAAVAWVGQKLLGSQLNKVTAMSYTVKGSWSDPVIKKDELSDNALENLKNLFGLEDESKMVMPEVEKEEVH